jgi:hypothetical protein
MLLTEIKTIKRQLADGTYAHEFDEPGTLNAKEYKTGIHTVQINLQKEELMLFNRYNLLKLPASIPVLHAYSLDKTPIGWENQEHTTGLMDAIKKRNTNHTMSDAEIEKFVRVGLKKVISHILPKPEQRTSRDKQYAAIQKMFVRLHNNKIHPDEHNQVVLVTLSSSSPVVKQFANIISEYLSNINIIHGAFLKNHWPRLSNYVYTGGIYEPRGVKGEEHDTAADRSISPHNRLKELQNTIAHLKQHIVRLNNADFDTIEELDMTHRELTKAENELATATDRLENSRFSIHNAIAPVGGDRDRGFYNFQLAVKHIASQLQDKDIIFIDDNVVSGHTFSDAIISLYKMRIHPKSMVGFCPHKLYNSRKEPNAQGALVYKTPHKRVYY